MKTTLAIIGGVLLLAAFMVLTATWRWRAQTGALVARLDSAADRRSLAGGLFEGMDDLPPPVARYFRAALGGVQVPITEARIQWEGQFLVRPESQGWAPFKAVQEFRPAAPGFVWDARIRMGPGIYTCVRDGFVYGEGIMRAAVMGIVTVVNAPATAELDAGALQRYLAEAVWLPTALLPSQGVRWTPLSASSARASLSSGKTTVALDFRFGADSLVESVYTDARFRDVDGTSVPTPWEGRFFRYEDRHGLMIPVEADVAWLLPGQRITYWRGSLREAEYRWAR